ncbi:MAG: substrate-binding domain-containing protein [Lachnospiraceae bacterium]|nr:substrate-binding domain-containing protein [Lachnospiraceae bacterium]
MTNKNSAPTMKDVAREAGVASDNLAGGQMAVRKLSELGCQRLLHLSIGSALPNEAAKRRDGFVSACVSLNLAYDMLCLTDGTPYSAVDDYLKGCVSGGKFSFDGIFCGTDHLAVRIMQSLHDLGIRVPEDVQIIGFDGMQDYATGQYLCSTIVQPIEQIAQTSVELVLSQDVAQAPSLVCLPVRYANGGTTKE